MRSKFLAFATAAATILLVSGGAYAQNQTTPDIGAGSQARYQNQQFNFSLNYPADMSVSEDHYGTGAETILFAGSTSTRPFQIVVIPYSTVNLTGDVPTPDSSASASDQGDTLSDVNVVMSDTDNLVQILFTKNGVLYQVVCSRDDEPRLLSLLRTWRFQ